MDTGWELHARSGRAVLVRGGGTEHDPARLRLPEALVTALHEWAGVAELVQTGESAQTGEIVSRRGRQLAMRIAAETGGRIGYADPFSGEWTLEVSSAGIDRPLTRLKDYDDWSGHEARITLAEPMGGRKQFSGTLRGTGEGHVVHMLGRDGNDYVVPFSSIASAKLLLTDELINSTNPLSTEGADKIVETEG